MNNFKNDLLTNIEKEITDLGKKVSKTREGIGSPAEYKNLIQAYKEIVELYYKIRDDIDDKEGIESCDNKIYRVQDIIDEINGLEYINKMSREVPDLKILTKKENNTWEVRKELTLNNHLLFLWGNLLQPGNYSIDGKKITMNCNGPTHGTFRIVWLDNDSKIEELEKRLKKLELNSKEEVKCFKTSEVVLLEGEKESHKPVKRIDTGVNKYFFGQTNVPKEFFDENGELKIEEYLQFKNDGKWENIKLKVFINEDKTFVCENSKEAYEALQAIRDKQTIQDKNLPISEDLNDLNDLKDLF